MTEVKQVLSVEELLHEVEATVEDLATQGKQRIAAASDAADAEMERYHRSKQELEAARGKLVRLRGLQAQAHTELSAAQLEENGTREEEVKGSYRERARRISYLESVEKDAIAEIGNDTQVTRGLRGEQKRRDAALAALAPLQKLQADVQRILNKATTPFHLEIKKAVEGAEQWRSEIKAREWDLRRYGPEGSDDEKRGR